MEGVERDNKKGLAATKNQKKNVAKDGATQGVGGEAVSMVIKNSLDCETSPHPPTKKPRTSRGEALNRERGGTKEKE